MALIDLGKFTGQISQGVSTPNLSKSGEQIVYEEMTKVGQGAADAFRSLWEKSVMTDRQNTVLASTEKFQKEINDEYDNAYHNMDITGKVSYSGDTLTDHINKFINKSQDRYRQELSDSASKRMFDTHAYSYTTSMRLKAPKDQFTKGQVLYENQLTIDNENKATNIIRSNDSIEGINNGLVDLKLSLDSASPFLDSAKKAELQHRFANSIQNAGYRSLIMRTNMSAGMTTEADQLFGLRFKFGDYGKFKKYYIDNFAEGLSDPTGESLEDRLKQIWDASSTEPRDKNYWSDLTEEEYTKHLNDFLSIKIQGSHATTQAYKQAADNLVARQYMRNPLTSTEYTKQGSAIIAEMYKQGVQDIDARKIDSTLLKGVFNLLLSRANLNPAEFSQNNLTASEEGLFKQAKSMLNQMYGKDRIAEIESGSYDKTAIADTNFGRATILKDIKEMRKIAYKNRVAVGRGTIGDYDEKTSRLLSQAIVNQDGKYSVNPIALHAFNDHLDKIQATQGTLLKKTESPFSQDFVSNLASKFKTNPQIVTELFSELSIKGNSGRALVGLANDLTIKGVPKEVLAPLMVDSLGTDKEKQSIMKQTLVELYADKDLSNPEKILQARNKSITEDAKTNTQIKINSIKTSIGRNKKIKDLRETLQYQGVKPEVILMHQENIEKLALDLYRKGNDNPTEKAIEMYSQGTLNSINTDALKMTILPRHDSEEVRNMMNKKATEARDKFLKDLDAGNLYLDVDKIPTFKKRLDLAKIQYDPKNPLKNRKQIVEEFDKFYSNLVFTSTALNGEENNPHLTYIIKEGNNTETGAISVMNGKDIYKKEIPSKIFRLHNIHGLPNAE